MSPFQEACAHVCKTGIGGVFVDTDRDGNACSARIRLCSGTIKHNIDHVRKLIQMLDEMPTDGSAPRVAITTYVSAKYVAFRWAAVERDRTGEWDILYYPAKRGDDFDLVTDYVHNIQQKQTTLFWELLTRVDRTA